MMLAMTLPLLWFLFPVIVWDCAFTSVQGTGYLLARWHGRSNILVIGQGSLHCHGHGQGQNNGQGLPDCTYTLVVDNVTVIHIVMAMIIALEWSVPTLVPSAMFRNRYFAATWGPDMGMVMVKFMPWDWNHFMSAKVKGSWFESETELIHLCPWSNIYLLWVEIFSW